jgi:hypothetical protein
MAEQDCSLVYPEESGPELPSGAYTCEQGWPCCPIQILSRLQKAVHFVSILILVPRSELPESLSAASDSEFLVLSFGEQSLNEPITPIA